MMDKDKTHSANDTIKNFGREMRVYSKIGSDDGKNTTNNILNILTNRQQTSSNSNISIKERE